MDEEVKKKRGRPPKIDSKHHQYRLRLSDKDLKMLEYIRKYDDRSTADIYRNGLEMMYHLTQAKH